MRQAAARRQRQHVERLAQPSARRRTVYVHAYNAEDELRYKTINISQDMTQMSQLLDKIHMAVGFKLITPVVGIYRYTDRTRIHNLADIQNNEHLIYVCQGEVQNNSNNNNSYASSQSSEGSQQRQQWMNLQALPRQNSGRSSPGPVKIRSQRRQDNMDWQRAGSGTIQYDGTFRTSQQSRQQNSQQQPNARPLQYQFSSSSSSSMRSSSSRLRGSSKDMSRTSFDQRNLRVSKTMPQYRQYQETQNFGQQKLGQQGNAGNFQGGPHSRRAISFQERSRSPFFLPTQNVAPVIKNTELHRRKGKSQTDIQFNQDNFSFDVRMDNADEAATATPTYASHLNNKHNSNFIQGQEQQFNNFNNNGRLSPISAPFSEGINFEHTRPMSRQEQHHERESTGLEEQILANITDAPFVRLSPIHEPPSDSPRVMPPSSEINHDKPEAEKIQGEDGDDKTTRQDEITFSLTLQDIRDAANQELNRQQNLQMQNSKVHVPEIKLDESLDDILRMVERGAPIIDNDENFRDSYRRQSEDQIDVLNQFESKNISKSSEFSEENFDSRVHENRRDEDPLEKTMTEEQGNFEHILEPSQYTPAVDYNDHNITLNNNVNDGLKNNFHNLLKEKQIRRPATPYYQDEDVQLAIDNIQHVFGNGSRDVQQKSDPNPQPPHEYSGSQTSVNSNRDVQVQSMTEQTSRQKKSAKKGRKRSTSFWSCMYLPDVNEE